MRARLALALSLALGSALVLGAPSRAQHRPLAVTPGLVTTPPDEAHQFDFLLGDWNLVAMPHVSSLVALVHGQPKLGGRWKAWRSIDGFGVEDEMRLVNDAGDPLAFVHSLRVFDRATHAWSTAVVDVYRTHLVTGTAVWKGGVMETSGEGTTDEGKRYVTRTRYSGIRADGFHFEQQRSYDGGKTWKDPQLVIEARRAAPATAHR